MEKPIEILYYQIKTVQEFVIGGNSLFSGRQRVVIGIAHILEMKNNTTPMAPPGTKVISHENQINVLHGSNMEYQGGISSQR